MGFYPSLQSSLILLSCAQDDSMMQPTTTDVPKSIRTVHRVSVKDAEQRLRSFMCTTDSNGKRMSANN